MSCVHVWFRLSVLTRGASGNAMLRVFATPSLPHLVGDEHCTSTYVHARAVATLLWASAVYHFSVILSLCFSWKVLLPFSFLSPTNIASSILPLFARIRIEWSNIIEEQSRTVCCAKLRPNFQNRKAENTTPPCMRSVHVKCIFLCSAPMHDLLSSADCSVARSGSLAFAFHAEHHIRDSSAHVRFKNTNT
uniref:Uncharacterized protein n=1 Tax=Craspedostauros australis TaxID=1486917 RepID=A0A7R9WMZ3_9STRA|mmetsp:Transcript_10969/g.30310  ORF Transcript_10969/g.30310 Transcript_10969/m.30310 type:complete len:191 (+) Transcript_10969:939-1511(+)